MKLYIYEQPLTSFECTNFYDADAGHSEKINKRVSFKNEPNTHDCASTMRHFQQSHSKLKSLIGKIENPESHQGPSPGIEFYKITNILWILRQMCR